MLLGSLILAAAVIVLFSAVIIGLYKIDMISLPDYLSGLLSGGTQSAGLPDAKTEAAADALKSDEADTEIVRLDDTSLVKSMIATNMPTDFSEEHKVVVYSEGAETTRLYRAVKYKDKYRVDIYSEDCLLETVICSGTLVTVTDAATNKKETFPYNSSFDFFTVADRVSVIDIINTVSNIRSGTVYESVFGSIRSYSISINKSLSSNIAKITFTYTDTPERRDEFFLNIDSGILVSAETYIGGQLRYSLTGGYFSTDMSKLDTDSVFS